MKTKLASFAPLWIALAVICLVCAVRLAGSDLLERLELLTYDIRVRQALRVNPPASDKLGFIFIDESTVRAVYDGSLGFRYGLYWPRQVYGRVLHELSEQEARAVALDVVFAELRPDHAPVQTVHGELIESDEWFALQLRLATNAILAVAGEPSPPDLFLTNAHWKGDISTEKDEDGILRRVRAFQMYRDWHPAFRQLEAEPEYGVDLGRVTIRPREIILHREGLGDITLPLDAEGTFSLADFAGEGAGTARAKPFTESRVWHMGIVLAALELQLDLSNARVELDKGFIELRGGSGVVRRIPVDREGRFFVNWALTPNDPRLQRRPMQQLLEQNKLRLEGKSNLPNEWKGKLVVVGSSALMGNNLTDRGATPFSPDTLLVSKHWNVANSILTNRFVQRAPLSVDLLLIGIMGAMAAIITWRLRAVSALVLIVLLAAGYILLSSALFIQSRYWLPQVLPVLGALLTTHVCLVTWRVVFEQAARRRVAAVLATIVSPKIARELLKAEKLSLGGARREITVLFADVRGFTELTDASQERAEAYIRSKALTGEAAEAIIDESARATLETVNLYLGTLADIVVSHDGTLDKFIGDCVMAFWGAPNPAPTHAISCVRAAIEAQRAIRDLNERRKETNRLLEIENRARESAGLPPKLLLPVLHIGVGINSGAATVGLMGSEVQAVVRQGNYTVFGREVNLASRLESLSGKGRILISQSTFGQIRSDDAELARLCVPLPPVAIKGIRHPVQVYEIRWDTQVPVESARAVAGGLPVVPETGN